MSEPHVCPKCRGAKVQDDPATGQKQPCAPCEGSGVVWEPQESIHGGKVEPGSPFDLTGS